jgi:hypothetical protein
MDYTTLVGLRTVDGSIKAWLNNSTIPSTTVLEEAERYIYSRIRVREMLASTTGTLGSATETIALPDDYIRMERIAFTGEWAQELDRMDPGRLEAMYRWDENGTRLEGLPTAYASIGTILQLDSPADQAYPYRALYYARPAALGTGNTTNFLTDRYPRLLRSTCLAFANEWLKKADEKQYWLTIAENEIAQAQRESESEQRRNADMMVFTR